MDSPLGPLGPVHPFDDEEIEVLYQKLVESHNELCKKMGEIVISALNDIVANNPETVKFRILSCAAHCRG